MATTANNAGFCTTAIFNPDRAEIWSVGGVAFGGVSGRAAFYELSGARCFSTYSDVPWLRVAPPSGSVAADAAQPLAVTLDASGLAAGDYAATLVVVSNDRLLRVPVHFSVAPRYDLWLPLVFGAPAP